MNSSKVLAQLKSKYPGKAIFPNDAENPTEILCEIEPTSEHPEYSMAISVIDRSVPHYHKQLTEECQIIKGKLTLHLGDDSIILQEGDKYTILPGTNHWAEGEETWIECLSTPGWTPGDHILV